MTLRPAARRDSRFVDHNVPDPDPDPMPAPAPAAAALPPRAVLGLCAAEPALAQHGPPSPPRSTSPPPFSSGGARAAEETGGRLSGSAPRARLHCRFAPPPIRFIPDSLTYAVHLSLKWQCGRTPGEGAPSSSGSSRGDDSEEGGARTTSPPRHEASAGLGRTGRARTAAACMPGSLRDPAPLVPEPAARPPQAWSSAGSGSYTHECNARGGLDDWGGLDGGLPHGGPGAGLR
jgi:hypothetical protein